MRYAFIILILCSFSLAQTNNELDEAKSLLKTLIEYSLDNNFESAAKLIYFDGENNSNQKPRSFDWNNPKEQKDVTRICKKIRAFIKFADEYEIGNHFKPSENDSDIGLELKLISAGKETVYKFFFKNIDGKILLSGIS